MRIAILNIDGLQPAYLGAYGCEWIETPTFDHWATAGVVFDQHFADKFRLQLPGEAIATNRRGAAVALRKSARADRAVVHIEIDALMPPWKLKTAELEPFFVDSGELEPWLDPLPSEIDPEDEATFARLQATYAAAVAKLDADLAKLPTEGYTLVVTSNRGLPLGEHGYAGFSAPLYEELVHLPLIVVPSDGSFAGRRVSVLTQPADLSATIAHWIGRDASSGHNLWPPPTAAIRPRAVALDAGRASIRTPDWHWLAPHGDDDQQLFVKPDDRWDINNVAQHHHDQCDEFRDLPLRFAPAGNE